MGLVVYSKSIKAFFVTIRHFRLNKSEGIVE